MPWAVPSNMFTAGGTGHRISLKTTMLEDFFVEHLSGYEHNVEKSVQPSRRSSSYARRALGTIHDVARTVATTECSDLASRRYHHGLASLALIPFYGGPPEEVGNAHSTSSRQIKILQTSGAICAASRYFHRVVVGVTTREDAGAIEALNFDFVDVLTLAVHHGVQLPFVFLRTAQESIQSGKWPTPDIVSPFSPRSMVRRAYAKCSRG